VQLSKLSKRAERKPQSSAAPFLVVVTLVIIFYIIFLQPEDRLELLGEGTGSGSNTSTRINQSTSVLDRFTLKEFVFKGPGELSYQPRSSYEHNIPSFYFRGDYQGQILLEENSFFVSSSLFSSKQKKVSFQTPNPNNLRNVILTFNAPQRAPSAIIIELNGVEIYSGQIYTYNIAPIKINTVNLQPSNNITIKTTSPGLAFWEENSYQIESFKISAEYIDTDGLSTTHKIDLRVNEIQNLLTARLRFDPRCSESTVQRLTIDYNGEEIYSTIPDCGMINTVPIPRKLMQAGTNAIYFESAGGSYLVDQISVLTQLQEDKGITYFFDLSKEYFRNTVRSESVCGEIDGICPFGCSQDTDADCCFAEYTNAYWCTVPTRLSGDRCVGSVTIFNVDRCPSGYQDKFGRVPEDFRGICGDDNDNFCPSGCSAIYDKDCCLTQDSNNYWCPSLPIGGIAAICKTELTQSECQLCQGGYIGEGTSPSCQYDSRNPIIEETNLDGNYKVIAEFYIVDDGNLKTADLNINGQKTSISTRTHFVEKDITSFVKDNNNYIQIIPTSNMNLVEVRVKLKRR
jgi:hypothetical protein